MKTFSSSITIDAPASKIWSILTDGAAYPSWNPTVVKVEGTIAAGGDVLVCVDAAADGARHLDLGAWQRALASFDGEWLAPALAALRQGRARRISIHAPGDRATLVADLVRPRLWPFWKRPVPLQAFIVRQQ